jgi:hypothetical protein
MAQLLQYSLSKPKKKGEYWQRIKKLPIFAG